MTHTEESENAWIDEQMRPRFANTDDGCGNHWWEYRRLAAWVSPLQWTLGVEIQPTTDDGYRGFVVLHLGPLWISWETTHG